MTSQNAPLYLAAAALIAGAIMPVQGALNSQLRHALGGPVPAALLSFAVGTAALLIITLSLRQIPTIGALRPVPWHVLLGGGLIGAVFVTLIAALASRLGVAALFAMVLAGQLIAAGILDHMGWLGLPQRPLTGTRLTGLGLLIVGGILATRG
jgi:transporter family-2 protein